MSVLLPEKLSFGTSQSIAMGSADDNGIVLWTASLDKTAMPMILVSVCFVRDFSQMRLDDTGETLVMGGRQRPSYTARRGRRGHSSATGKYLDSHFMKARGARPSVGTSVCLG